MKIRTDYVSNSSSSSFVLFGTRKEFPLVSVSDVSSVESHKNGPPQILTIEDFADLKADEAIFLVLRSAGNEGDYIFKMSPELLMDCDIHQIDLSRFIIVKAKYYMTEGGYMYRAAKYHRDIASWLDDEDEDDRLSQELKTTGVDLTGLKAFGFSQDYETPKVREEIITALENHCKYVR